jgi:hypothetical protein
VVPQLPGQAGRRRYGAPGRGARQTAVRVLSPSHPLDRETMAIRHHCPDARTEGLNRIQFGEGWSNATSVELRGFEPLTPCMPSTSSGCSCVHRAPEFVAITRFSSIDVRRLPPKLVRDVPQYVPHILASKQTLLPAHIDLHRAKRIGSSRSRQPLDSRRLCSFAGCPQTTRPGVVTGITRRFWM